MNKTTALRDLPNVTGIIKGNGTSGFSAADEGTDYQGPIALTTIGTSGTAGWDGTTLNIPNYANNVGSSGTSGQSGATGSSGSSGSSGQTGGTGSSGSSGSSGQTGAAGSSGSSGQSGAAGSSGSSGSSGQTGAAGSSGSSGQTGGAGSSGSSGSSGQSGAAGSSGSSGQSGAAGSSGSSGQSGAAGSSGSSGSSGTRGSSGSSGSSGQTGAAGSSGSSGQTGGAGSSGSSGSSGQTGGAGSSGTSGTSPSAAAYVAKAGDTMTGTLVLNFADPFARITASSGSYSYVQLNDATSSGYIIKNTSSATSNGVIAGALYLYTDNSKPTQIVHSGSSNAAFLSGGDVYIRGQIYVGGNGASTGTQVVYNSGTWSISISGNATTATNLAGAGGSYIQSTSTGTSYQYNYQVRENSGGGSNTSEIYAPQLGFHWSGVVASSIMMEASGRIAIRNNPGSAYESFIASDITASSSLRVNSNTTTGTTAGVVNLGTTSDPSSISNSSIIGLTWGLRGDSQGYYIVRSNNMTYGGYTYNRLDLSWHTGIVIGAATLYGGIRFWNNSTNIGSLIASIGDGDNNMRSTADIIAYASDKRLKENVINIPNALDKIKQINGVYFDWKDKTKELGFNPSQKNDVGVIAQEIQAILPEVVTLAPFDYELGKSKSGENYLTVKYDKLAPLFIEAIKELNQKVEDQQKIINDLLRR